MEKLIFLDVDGVFNTDNTKERTSQGFVGIEPCKVALLADIIKQTDAKVVVSSTWRLDKEFYDELKAHLWAFDIVPYGETPNLGRERRGEIANWLIDSGYTPESCRIVVIDDMSSAELGTYWTNAKFIQTDNETGLTTSHVVDAIMWLNG